MRTPGVPPGAVRTGGLDARNRQGIRIVRPRVGAETAGPDAPSGTPGVLIAGAFGRPPRVAAKYLRSGHRQLDVQMVDRGPPRPPRPPAVPAHPAPTPM